MKKTVLLAYALILAFASSAFALAPIKAEDQNPAFIYFGPAADGGYNYVHDLAASSWRKIIQG